jgi:starch-binding outer membrane protein, SusD/RagB family
MKKTIYISRIVQILSLTLVVSCTNLDEQILDGAAKGAPKNPTAFLKTAYKDLRAFQAQGQMFALDEMSSDALVGPTRGGDWDDNGSWRKIHLHTWTPQHSEVSTAYNSLLSAVYDCNTVIEANNATESEKTEARFLKAFFYYNVIDLFGKAPYRPIGSPSTDDAKVYTRAEATDYVISELEAIVSSLPTRVSGSPDKANQDAAHFLLAKLYLNKSIFSGSATAADYTKVVQNVDAMTNSLASDYWDNFAPTNNTSDEMVFTSKNEKGKDNGGDIRSRFFMGAHYNQTPGGWNGFTTLGEYYDRYDSTDKRIFNPKPSVIATNGYNLGFQIGQQYGPGGVTPLTDRIDDPTSTTVPKAKQPLIFTKAITIITSGATLESAGIRGQKYEPSPLEGDVPDNDYVLMRYSDALLMKAEAIARGGSGTLGTIATDLAVRTGQPAVDLTDLNVIYAERGRELWWEGWRRNDMIRFGKFLDTRELKPYVSDSKYLLYPVPTAALYNPNMTQNPGY